MYWRRKWQPTPVFSPGESQDGGAWWAAIYGVSQSRTRLKRLSSSSSSSRGLQECHYLTSRTQDLTPISLQQLTPPLPHFSCKRVLLRTLGEFGAFKGQAIHLLAGRSANLSLFQTPTFWYCLISLYIGHVDLHFNNIMVPCCCLVAKLCLMLYDPMDCSPPGSSVHGIFRVGCHFLLQGIFPTQESNPYLLHWRVDSLPPNHPGSQHNDGEQLSCAN